MIRWPAEKGAALHPCTHIAEAFQPIHALIRHVFCLPPQGLQQGSFFPYGKVNPLSVNQPDCTVLLRIDKIHLQFRETLIKAKPTCRHCFFGINLRIMCNNRLYSIYCTFLVELMLFADTVLYFIICVIQISSTYRSFQKDILLNLDIFYSIVLIAKFDKSH